MRRWIVIALLFPVLNSQVGLGGCFYVTQGEFYDAWDEDGDGWGIDEDCEPSNPLIYPGARDVRGDKCDSDCGYEPDTDGDDWPDDYDCAPDDPLVYPGSVNGDNCGVIEPDRFDPYYDDQSEEGVTCGPVEATDS